MARVLVACEESQVVCKAFRAVGHEAYSCDVQPCSGGHPEWHIQDDVLRHLEGWDLIIAHPPCTYLCVSGNKWFKPEFQSRFPDRQFQRELAVSFFMDIAFSPCSRIAIENPVGIMSTRWRKPDQYVEPYFFGDPAKKKTGLWLKGLPNLVPTDIVSPQTVFCRSGVKVPLWHMQTMNLPPDVRSRVRSRTYPGIASAMATQWGLLL